MILYKESMYGSIYIVYKQERERGQKRKKWERRVNSFKIMSLDHIEHGQTKIGWFQNR